MEHFDHYIQSAAQALGWPGEAIVRLVLAAMAGGLIGIEREMRGRQAGFRTNLLVCLGSALVMVVSTRFAFVDWPAHQHSNINIDPARIAYSVMSGVGFLGAGTIIQQRGSVRGLTTAAGLWCVAALGLSAGFGLYLLTIVAALLVVLTLWVLDYFEAFLPRLHYRTITIRCRWNPGCIADSVQRLKEAHLRVLDMSFRRTPDLVFTEVEARIAFFKKRRYYDFERQIEQNPDWDLVASQEL